MSSIYYIQVEDKHIPEGNNINTLAGLKDTFNGSKEVIVFSNNAKSIQTKYAKSGIKTTIYNNDDYILTDIKDLLETLKTIFVAKDKYLIVFDNSNYGNTLAAMLSAILDITFVTNVQNVVQESGIISVKQPIGKTKVFRQIILGEKAVISISCNGILQEKFAEVKTVDWQLKHTNASSYIFDQNTNNDLSYAKVVVSGGKGLGSAINFKPLEQLATRLNASLAVTKAVSDQGWISPKRMVGISNLTITPNVYYAFGISGAVQHTIGMNKSKCVVAVNTDRTAPIFKLAQYGIIGDANTVIDQLNKIL